MPSPNPPSKQRRSPISRVVSLLAITVASLALLELSLQLLSFGVWLFGSPTPAVPVKDGQRVVLCVGDSFTFGMGASSQEAAYPAQLAKRLGQDGSDGWTVVNQGWPGRNSRQVLERLDKWLVDYSPEYVCVVVGVNDTWSHPDEFVLPELSADVAGTNPDAFRWEFRTLKLLHTFRKLNPFRDGDAAPTESMPTSPSDHPLIGVWTVVGTNQRFEARDDGTGEVGDHAFQWSGSAERIRLAGAGFANVAAKLTAQDGCVVLEFDNGSQLALVRPEAGEAIPAQPVKDESRASWVAVYQAIDDRNWPDAEARLNQIRATLEPGTPDDLRAEAVQVRILAADGRPDAAKAALERILQQHAENPRYATHSALATAYHSSGEAEKALDHARRSIELNPRGTGPWGIVASSCERTGDLAGAREAIENALEHTAARNAGTHYLWSTRARLYSKVDKHEVARSIAEAWAAYPNVSMTRQQLLNLQKVFEPADLESACDRIGLGGASRTEFLQLAEAARTGKDTKAYLAIYRSHLEQIVDRCRARGAEPILGTYPWSKANFYPTQNEVANSRGVRWVRIDEVFAEIKRREPDADLFAGDGHCNDAGYSIMAREFAEQLEAAKKPH